MLLLFAKLKEFISSAHASLVSWYHGSILFLFSQLNVYYIFFFSACLLPIDCFSGQLQNRENKKDQQTGKMASVHPHTLQGEDERAV